MALQGEKISAMLIKGKHFTIAALVGTRKKSNQEKGSEIYSLLTFSDADLAVGPLPFKLNGKLSIRESSRTLSGK